MTWSLMVGLSIVGCSFGKVVYIAATGERAREYFDVMTFGMTGLMLLSLELLPATPVRTTLLIIFAVAGLVSMTYSWIERRSRGALPPNSLRSHDTDRGDSGQGASCP
jgi:hypothetical protein